MHSVGNILQDITTYDKLKLMILGGEIAAGEPLVERVLAEQLGVSRTPVRETIHRLEKEGLVRVIGGKGAFVAVCSVEDMIEIYQVREGLEPIAARVSCAFLEPNDLQFYEDALKRYQSKPSLRDDDPDAWRRLGRDFHNLFIRASRNHRLIKVIEGMQDQIELFRGLGRTISRRGLVNSAIEEHLEILNALKARAPARAEKAVRVHLQNGLKYRLEGLHQKPIGR